MPHRLSPDLYAVGVLRLEPEEISTGEAYQELLNVPRWLDMGMRLGVWRQGVLRDVYPWNFLTAPQLAAKVEGCSLRAWISQDVRRGTLTAVSDAVVPWCCGTCRRHRSLTSDPS